MGNVTRLLEAVGASGLEWDYGETVSVEAEVPLDAWEYLTREFEELKARGIIAEWVEADK